MKTRKKQVRFLLMVFFVLAAFHVSAVTNTFVLADMLSADRKIEVLLLLRGNDLSYQVTYSHVEIIAESGMGIFSPFCQYARTEEAIEKREVNSSWRNPFGERSLVVDRYQAWTVPLLETSQKVPVRLECRLYNEGFAFRFVFPASAGKTVTAEKTEFSFTHDWCDWPVYHAQGRYAPAKISTTKSGAERPLTVEMDGCVAAIGEAGLIDFCRMKFEGSKDKANTLVSRLDSPAKIPASGVLPWRYVRVAPDICSLYNGNDFLLNLNEPSKIADTSWIKPGKVIRCVKLSTSNGKACVDFCRQMGLQYVELDAGWYGRERVDDARRPGRFKPDPKEPFDLFEIIRYAKERGVGVLLYINQNEMEKHLDECIALYKKWGVAGMKYGFVKVGSQLWTCFVSDAIKKAAGARMLLDIHDEYRLTGNQRAWPNVMTVEGVYGNEEMPDAAHNCALPFTRYLGGPGDYTPCWTSSRVQNTRTHQLALAAVYFSPFQFLYWYDRPSQVKDEPALDFWRKIPTVWDETRALQGKIGEYAVMARRSGGRWFIGGINGWEKRGLEIPLDFLPPGKTYAGSVFEDGAEKTSVTCRREKSITSRSVLRVRMAASGGFAACFSTEDE